MNKFLILLIIAGLIIPATFVFAVSNTTGFGWATKAGWINFGCNDCNVQITNNSLTGYIWSTNYGWINLNPSNGGITNNGGTLSGYAWGKNTGWINFGSVTIDSNGNLNGTALGNTVGTIIFTNCGASCGVQTNWRPVTGNLGDDCVTPGNACLAGYCGTDNLCGGSGATCSTDDDCDADNYCNANVCTSFFSASFPVSNITVNSAGNTTTIVNNNNLQMSVVVLPSSAVQAVTWSVINETGTATINSSGLLTATSAGTVTVKATATDTTNIVGTKQITINAPLVINNGGGGGGGGGNYVSPISIINNKKTDDLLYVPNQPTIATICQPTIDSMNKVLSQMKQSLTDLFNLQPATSQESKKNISANPKVIQKLSQTEKDIDDSVSETKIIVINIYQKIINTLTSLINMFSFIKNN